MAVSEKEYEEIRADVIKQYRKLYKDALAMDACKVPKEVRIRLLEDKEYITQTKAIKAGLFAQQLDTLDSVLAGSYQGEKQTDQSGVILKALEMKNKLLLEDLNITKDDSNALNITFVGMSREDFEAQETVEVVDGESNAKLGADFGDSGGNDSFEDRMKAEIKKKLKENEEAGNGSAS